MNKDEDIYEYLKEILEKKNDIYTFLKQHYNKNKYELEEALIHACNAINEPPEDKIRIPVFAKYGEPIYLNLYNLSSIGFLDKYHKYNEVIVMENPAVFMEVSEKTNKKDIPMVCTYGQVKLAGIIQKIVQFIDGI